MEQIDFLNKRDALSLINKMLPQKIGAIFNRYNEITPSALDKVNEELRLGNKWVQLPEWDAIENGDDDFEEKDFYKMVFKHDDLSNDNILLSTLESTSLDRFFEMPSEKLLHFMENYSDYTNSKLLFVQPTPYLFILLRRRIIYGIHDEGYLMKLMCNNL